MVPARVLVSIAAVVTACAVLAGCSPTSERVDGGQASTSAVVIDELAASRSRVSAGSVVSLSWRTRNAAGCELDPGFGAVPRSGSVSATPAATTTWTLSCAGGGATASEDVTVEVIAVDAGADHSGTPDSGPPDSGPPDSGPLDDDTGPSDGGTPDAGPAFVTSGDVSEAPPIASFDELADNTKVWLITERAGVAIEEDLPCDIHYPATYDGVFGINEPGCTLPAGVRVDSFLVHVPPGGPAPLVGSVTLASEILALQWRMGTLSATDAIVGLEGVAYPTAESRDYGIGYSDVVTLAEDRRTLTVSVNASNLDQLRVLTLAAGEDPPLVLSSTLAPTSEIASLLPGDVESLDEAVLLFERTITLADDLSVEIGEPGVYTDFTQLTPATLSAGTSVKSALVHFDPTNGDAGTPALIVTATFPRRVLGLFVNSAGLLATDDVLGLEQTTYSVGDGRDLESGTGDEVWLSEDGRSLRLDVSVFGSAIGIDEVRVLYEP